MKIYLLLFLVMAPALFAKTVSFGDSEAKKGGSIVISFGGYPKSLLYYLAADTGSHLVSGLVLDTLLEMDVVNYEPTPLLAESWTVSPDKKTFTFVLNPKATFSDGKPVTAEDVKFTWDAIMNPKNATMVFQSTYKDIESCAILDLRTIQFKAKNIHFQNLENLGSLMVLPKHVFSTGDFNKAFNRTFSGSGPYEFSDVRPGEKIVLARNKNYWASTLPQNVGRYNFDRMTFKVVDDPHVELEMFKRGDIDYLLIGKAKIWVNELVGESYDKNWTVKFRGVTKIPESMAGIEWNARRPLFSDRRVRIAMSHLMNREQWIKDLFYNEYIPTSGVMAPKSEYQAPGNTPLPNSPKKAKELLKEAGWTEINSDGILVKGGLKFEFDLILTSQSLMPPFTLYQEDLKKMGIKMNIRVLDWAAAMKLTDEWKFDAYPLGWTREVDPSNFASMWGSREADQKGSQNLSGYKNPEVDKLCREIDQTFDKKRRIPLVQKLDAVISNDQPMSFMWEGKGYRIIHWNRFSFPKAKYPPYARWNTPIEYWWTDDKLTASLKEAKVNKTALK